MLPAKYQWVERLIAKNGRLVTIIIPDTIPEDTDKPWKGSGHHSDTHIVQKGVFIPSYVAQKDFGLSLDLEDLVAKCEQFVLFSGINKLTNAKFIMDGSVKWRVTFLSELRPAEHELFYAIGVAR